MRFILLLVINLYTWALSRLLGECCRFYPSCSVYAKQAINKFGAARGGWMTLTRILRCHPWCCGGYDPVP